MKQIITLLFILFHITIQAGPHTIQRGETMDYIAALYKIPLDSLLAANPDIYPATGLTIEVPIDELFYDLGNSQLFRLMLAYQSNSTNSIGYYDYLNGHKKQLDKDKYKQGGLKKSIQESIIRSYEKAITKGNLDALYQLGRYKIHNTFYPNDNIPDFSQGINDNIDEFQQGVEYLQIATLLGRNKAAAVELAIACGHKDSPIYNPYLCIEMLKEYYRRYSVPVRSLICYMYENGYGVMTDYLQAYIYCPDTRMSNGHGTTHREKILDKIEAMQKDTESARYGTDLDAQTLNAIGLAFYNEQDNVFESDGLFWLHQAARAGSADANWTLAALIQNKLYRNGYVAEFDKEEQMIYFARNASTLGNEEATQFVASYDEYIRQKKEYERQQQIRQQQIEEARKREQAQQWMNFAANILNVATQTYTMIQSSKSGYNSAGYASTQMPTLQMSDSQWAARNDLALRQIAQYTYNKTIADWYGVPMAPTDMSAVNLGTDMSVGSPLWMWNQQQQIHTVQTQYSRMLCEQAAFYHRQADNITQQLINNPLAPIPGFYDIDGNWITREMVENGYTQNQSERKRHSTSDRYGNKDCNICKGSGQCPTCLGRGYYYGDLGTGEAIVCPNCYKENGHSTGLCGKCGGSGQVYGLKN